MHFDDRLETVLRLPDSGDGLMRIQFRQLIDILGGLPADAESANIEAGFAQVASLSRRIPAADRARLLRQPMQPLINARLLGMLAEAEPDTASAAIGSAALDDAQWIALIPKLPIRARGILRHRRDLTPAVQALLDRLGVHDRGLPPVVTDIASLPPAADAQAPVAKAADAITPPQNADDADEAFVSSDVLDLLEPVDEPPPPTSLSEWARARVAREHAGPPAPSRSMDAGIGAIVRRIEEFRKARGTQNALDVQNAADAATANDTGIDHRQTADVIDFTTDQDGRIDWADGDYGPSVIGFTLAALHADTRPGASLPTAMRQRQPFGNASLRIDGAPAVSGAWQADGIPRFDPASGRFTGYCGRLRRQRATAALDTEGKRRREAERMREILHELRTPANAIQVAAEIIQQQLYGPAPHEYRALAAAIASDCAHILAGFEELDRLVKLETGALDIETGECDLAHVIDETVTRLRSWTEPRRSGFAFTGNIAPSGLLTRIEQAEAERLIWRVFAALAGSTSADETLGLSCWPEGGHVMIRIALPASLAARTDGELFGAQTADHNHPLSAGTFGVGFSLRLAAAEAASAGGGLQRDANTLNLWLPGLTPAHPDNSTATSYAH